MYGDGVWGMRVVLRYANMSFLVIFFRFMFADCNSGEHRVFVFEFIGGDARLT